MCNYFFDTESLSLSFLKSHLNGLFDRYDSLTTLKSQLKSHLFGQTYFSLVWCLSNLEIHPSIILTHYLIYPRVFSKLNTGRN